MVTVTACPGERFMIVNENNPSGKLNPLGGGGDMLPTAEAARVWKPPAEVEKVAVPSPVAVATLAVVGRPRIIVPL